MHRQQHWDSAVEEAMEQEINVADFAEFWLEERAAAGFY